MPEHAALAPPICRLAGEVLSIGRRVTQKGVLSGSVSNSGHIISFQQRRLRCSFCPLWASTLTAVSVHLRRHASLSRQDSVRSGYVSDRERGYLSDHQAQQQQPAAAAAAAGTQQRINHQASFESADSKLCYLTSSEVGGGTARRLQLCYLTSLGCRLGGWLGCLSLRV